MEKYIVISSQKKKSESKHESFEDYKNLQKQKKEKVHTLGHNPCICTGIKDLVSIYFHLSKYSET